MWTSVYSRLIPAAILIVSGWLHLRNRYDYSDIIHGLMLVACAVLLILWGHVRPIWRGGCVVFIVFASISFVKALSGASDCGCFPGWAIPPLVTAAMDVVLFLLLWKNPPVTINRPSWLMRGATTAILFICFFSAWKIAPSIGDGPWPAPLNYGGWRAISVRKGCEHCESALIWIIPMANAAPQNTALVSLSPSDNWLRERGLALGVTVLVRPSMWDAAPVGWLIRDGKSIGTFPIPDSVVDQDDQ